MSGVFAVLLSLIVLALVRISRQLAELSGSSPSHKIISPATSAIAAESIGADLRIIKRRMTYNALMCRDIRKMSFIVEQKWGGADRVKDPDEPLPWDRLAALQEMELEFPLRDKDVDEMHMLEQFVMNCRREADEDEFDAVLDHL